MFWKGSLSKKIALEYDFSCCINWKDKIWSYSLDGKWRMIFLKKKYMEIWYFLQMPRKDGLSKKTSRSKMIFLVLSGKMVFFSGKYYIFPSDGKWKMMLPFCKKKNQRWSSPEKKNLKGDWHSRSDSRKSSNDFLYFYGDLHRRFHILLSSEKNSRKLNIKDWNLTFSSIYLVREIPQWRIFNTLYNSGLRSCI